MRPEIRVEECTTTNARLVIGPLERGYGVTIGNALRRVLLSSIKGAAISAVRIDGALHEFTTLPGVKEDVIELMLNLKHIPVRSHSADVRVLKIEVQGPKRVTAADFTPDSEIEFINPDAYVCTLAEGHTLMLEVYIEQGAGYATVDRPRPSFLPVDALMIDAIFSPILRVKYDVQNERVGHRTDYEKVVMDVASNGVVAPDIAVAEAAKLLREYFNIVVKDIQKRHPSEEAIFDVDEDEGKTDLEPENSGSAGKSGENGDNTLLSRPVRDLELSIRSENCLLRGGIHTLGDLISRSKDDLLKIRNLGKISLREIKEKMAKYGIALRDEKAAAEKEKENTGKED